MPVSLGVFPSPLAADLPAVLAQVDAAERGGLELIGIQDHPYQRRFLDTFALMAAVLARTQRVRVFPDVANLPLRHPAMLAKAAASLDVLGAGRFELGLGAGGFWDGIAAMGGPRRSPGASVDALEEAIAILRAAWGPDRSVTFEGEHYSVQGWQAGPKPAHPIGIWIGAYKPRMLRLTGRLGDGWVPSYPYVTPEAVPQMRERIDEAAAGAGRSPSDIVRVLNVGGIVTDGGGTAELLHGPPAHWIDTLSEWATELGFDAFVFWPTEGDPLAQVERFAADVAPGVRERVP